MPKQGTESVLNSALENISVFVIKKRKLLVNIGLGALLMGNIIFILIPFAYRFYVLSLELSDLRSNKTTADYDLGQRERLEKAHTWSKTRLVLNEYLIARGDVSQHLESFTEIAKSSKVRLHSMQPVLLQGSSEGGSSKYYHFKYVTISASAGYHEMGEFIYNLEKYPYFMEIVNLEITGNDQARYTHDIKLVIRLLKTEKEEIKS